MATIMNDAAYMGFPLSIKRGNPAPVDTTAVWYNKTELETYAASGATAYVGQVLAYVNEAENTAKAYIIADTNGTLTEVGAATLGDNKTIVLEEGTLALKNWGKEYYRWVDAVGEEGKEGYVAGHHEKQVVDGTHPWIAGLEPKAVAGADGTFELAWYQPSTTTVEGLNSTVSSIRTTVEGITAALGDAETDGTIRGDIADLKTEVAKKIDAAGGTMTGDLTLADGSKAASETVVYTKIATAIGSAGHLKRLVVEQLPEVSAADVDTIYMVKDATVTTGDAYKEYMVIDGAFAQIGDTSVNLEPYATTADVEAKVKVVQDDLNGHKADAVAHITADERTAWNGKLDANNADYTTLVANKQKLVDIPAIKTIGTGLTLNEDGTLVGAQEYELPVATAERLGGVKAGGAGVSIAADGVVSAKVKAGNGLSVGEEGIVLATATDAAAGAMTAEEHVKLSNIEEGAQRNVVVGALVGGTAVTINENKQLVIGYADEERAGVVKSSSAEAKNKIRVETDGTMSLNAVGVSKLTNEDDCELILNCGNA